MVSHDVLWKSMEYMCYWVYYILLNCASKNIGYINPELLRVTWNTTVWRTGSLETLSRCKGLLGATVGAWLRDLSLAHAISFFSMSSLDCLEMYEKSWNLPDLYFLMVGFIWIEGTSQVEPSISCSTQLKLCHEPKEMWWNSWGAWSESTLQLFGEAAPTASCTKLGADRKWRLKWCQNIKWTYIWVLPERRYGGFQLPC